MFFLIIAAAYVIFAGFITWMSYYLGQTKTDNAKTAAIIGFALSFFPPFALAYLVILSLKKDVDIV